MLSKTEAKKLYDSGFKRPKIYDDVYPQDIYDYKNETWIVGGKVFPRGEFGAPKEVYTQGTWIPLEEDLISWMEEHDCTFIISFDGMTYKIEAADVNGTSYKAKGVSLELCLYKVIIQILHSFNGNMPEKEYELMEVDLIEKEDLQ